MPSWKRSWPRKKVNRPSDDPVGMGKILDYRVTKAGIAKYESNIESSESWLTITESKLTAMEDLVIQARGIALAQASATANAETRRIAAASIEPLMDELFSLANSKMGDRYLFSGSRTDVEPFPSASGAASVGTAEAASGNGFDGSVASGGTYTGTTNKTYVVKIVTGEPWPMPLTRFPLTAARPGARSKAILMPERSPWETGSP